MTRDQYGNGPARTIPAGTGQAPDAATVPEPERDPEVRPPIVTLKLRGMLDGFEVEIGATILKDQVKGMLKWARRLGLEQGHAAEGEAGAPGPAPKAQAGAKPADGMCPIHGVKMDRFEKDGRAWFSHKAEDDGGEYWCKGKRR